MTQRKQETSGQAPGAGVRTVGYFDAPTGSVVASEAALEAFRKTRPWALVFAVLLFMYAAVGGAVGVGWLVMLVWRLTVGPAPGRPFINMFSIHLLFAPIALVGGVLAIDYHRAAGLAYWRRNSEDLERAALGQKRLWLWAGVGVIVLIVFFVGMVIAAILTHEWPG